MRSDLLHTSRDSCQEVSVDREIQAARLFAVSVQLTPKTQANASKASRTDMSCNVHTVSPNKARCELVAGCILYVRSSRLVCLQRETYHSRLCDRHSTRRRNRSDFIIVRKNRGFILRLQRQLYGELRRVVYLSKRQSIVRCFVLCFVLKEVMKDLNFFKDTLSVETLQRNHVEIFQESLPGADTLFSSR